jgi:hypothetical protein
MAIAGPNFDKYAINDMETPIAYGENNKGTVAAKGSGWPDDDTGYIIGTEQ